MDMLKNYWPFIVLSLWFLYKWRKSQKILSLLPQLKQRGARFIDVRSAAEFQQAHAPGTINIPLQDLHSRVAEIPADVPVVVCCASGSRSAMAKMMLSKKGHKEVYNIGGWTKFLKAKSL